MTRLLLVLFLLITGIACSDTPPDDGVLEYGNSYKLDWDGKYTIQSRYDGKNSITFVELTGLHAGDDYPKTEVYTTGFGWVVDGQSLMADLFDKRVEIGTAEVFSDSSQSNGWGVAIHLHPWSEVREQLNNN